MSLNSHIEADKLLFKRLIEPLERNYRFLISVINGSTYTSVAEESAITPDQVSRSVSDLIRLSLRHGNCLPIKSSVKNIRENADVLRLLVEGYLAYTKKLMCADGNLGSYEERAALLFKNLKKWGSIERACEFYMLSVSEIEVVVLTYIKHLKIFFTAIQDVSIESIDDVMAHIDVLYALSLEYKSDKFKKGVAVSETTNLIVTGIPFLLIHYFKVNGVATVRELHTFYLPYMNSRTLLEIDKSDPLNTYRHDIYSLLKRSGIFSSQPI